MLRQLLYGLGTIAALVSQVVAGVGDPQLRTDHPWYPGELSCSSFERLQETQAQLFEHVTGSPPRSEEEKVLAAWMWRNLHYAHGEEGRQDLWGRGFTTGDTTTREYWSGLFSHGFGLCGTTHAQWTVELNALLGHCRSRTVGVNGHNAFEVFIQGNEYGSGQWILLDHDLSTVVFAEDGSRMLSISEIGAHLELTDPTFRIARQHGWPLAGLHPDDAKSVYQQTRFVEHLPGYAGPTPKLHLRSGETLTRFFEPGLEDGSTFVFWGRNYHADEIPGPERSRTWINQPERFFENPDGSGYRRGQARYGNAVFEYRPDFSDESFREGVVSSGPQHVTFEFQSPFVIAATPPDDSAWGIYEEGCTNGLIITADAKLDIDVSVDRGGSWTSTTIDAGAVDLTDIVKGCQQYLLRINEPATKLIDSNLLVRTVCQANPALFPRLMENRTTVTFQASQVGTVSAGPSVALANQNRVDSGSTPSVQILQLATPRNEPATHLYAAAHIASGNPPDPTVEYELHYSIDLGKTWTPIVENWKIDRSSEEPEDFWSQSFCYGDISLSPAHSGPVQIRCSNSNGKPILRFEAHLNYEIEQPDACRVTFHWAEGEGKQRTAHKVIPPSQNASWEIDTGSQVQMHSVKFEVE
ncbi:hypothetical protein KOR42_41250 [Thalassoglobus neptunius]|uniref:Uncharacterized protein n=1 Tax=Thalassoglobus neptunius TaxID=1938619 RepID=A0A5C5W9F4_9PLAN|nr:hypothetical protein [Thalassoglobus neptunius]TWT47127.1 hypothetical protein KOR42_41250 [Thalassoglobus neptunius]